MNGWLRFFVAPCLLASLAFLFPAPETSAHIGSPDVFYEGAAGPWGVRVIVRLPGVVPGLAEISVRTKDPGVQAVRVRPVKWELGLEGAPPPDEAVRVTGQDDLWSAELWLMTNGSYSVYVEVEGENGTGTAIVPVQSSATQRLEMPPWLGSVLLALAVLLVAGAVRLASAGVESTVAPGEEGEPAVRRRSRRAMGVAVVLVALVLYGGKTWWERVDLEYLDRMWSAFEITAEMRLQDAPGPRVLDLHLTDERFRRAAQLAPDHGKLMHMFLVREPELDAFAHLHPVPESEYHFAVTLPDGLPAGTYRVYADVTHEDGIAQTLTTTLEVGPSNPAEAMEEISLAEHPSPDPDDSYHVASPTAPAEHAFPDGYRLTWQNPDPPKVREETRLTFRLLDPEGEPATFEPYMGMPSHAAVRRHDGEVFIHLHPTGTVSMASRELSERRDGERRGEIPIDYKGPMDHEGMDHESMDHGSMDHSAMHSGGGTVEVEMPYLFPRPGDYRIWVQVKSGGRVYTGVFDTEVVE